MKITKLGDEKASGRMEEDEMKRRYPDQYAKQLHGSNIKSIAQFADQERNIVDSIRRCGFFRFFPCFNPMGCDGFK